MDPIPPSSPAPNALRRSLVLGGIGLLTSACSPTSTMGMLRDTLASALSDNAAYPRTRAQVEALPYAQLGIRIGTSERGILVLAQVQNGTLHWYSADRAMIVTRGQRILKSVGLSQDLLGTQLLTADLQDLYEADPSAIDGVQTRRSIDTGVARGQHIQASYTVEGEERITILDESFDTVRVRETFRFPVTGKAAINHHWMSRRSPLIWRSRQWLNEALPPVEIEVLKRPPSA